jgi:hypothetical protein
MKPKVLIAAAVFAAVPILALAEQDNPAEPTPKPTLEDVQKFVQSIIANKYKLQAYCDLGKLQGEMDKAEEKNDTEAIDALVVKADGLEEQLGAEYQRITDELGQLNPNSAEAQKFAAILKPIEKKCK